MTQTAPNADTTDFAARAGEAVTLLKALGNEKRLMILCKLIEQGEMSVTPLASAVGLSQSALSQHLARMRGEELVNFRREGQTLFYRVSDRSTRKLIKALRSIYC